MSEDTLSEQSLSAMVSGVAKELNSEDADSLGKSVAEVKVEDLPKTLLVEGGGMDNERTQDLRTMLQDMKIPEKIKLALLGNGLCRSLLILDPNKMIQTMVLRNPKLGITEVETFSKNPQISDFAIRSIADRKEWMKEYSIKVNIVTNPGSPPDLSLKWLRYLNQPELKRIARSKNVPQLISSTAKKRLQATERK